MTSERRVVEEGRGEMDRRALLERAARWMASRGWRGKLAKRRQYEQSLFEHSLIEMDVLLELLPILAPPRHYGLSEAEQGILAVAVLAHDVGKETDAWQVYIRDPAPGRTVPHIIPELTRAVVPELCAALGFEEPLVDVGVQRVMAQCAEFHHTRPGRGDGAVMEAMLTGGSDRFLTLATLVKAIDHLCSAASAADAEDTAAQDPALGRHLKIARHEVTVRGVSTTFLHRAARTAFRRRGWKPLLYFSNATLYSTDPTEELMVPTEEEIRGFLKREIGEAIARDVTPLMVGSPTGNILPKPDLFSFAESRAYLRSAGAKISPQSFARKPLRAKRKVVEDYWMLKGRRGTPTDDEVDKEAGRISVAQPEMLVLKFFKAMVDPEKVEAVGKDGAATAKKLYDARLGAGSWADLQSTSTIMPAKDMAKTVDQVWALPGSAVNHPEVSRVAELPPQLRMEVLIDFLDGIAQEVYSDRPSPRDKLSEAMSGAFIKDLLSPMYGSDVQALARRQLVHYERSKLFAGKETANGIYLCPICNAPFDSQEGIKASADFIDNPQTHTNRGVAHGSFGYVMVCTTCYYERLLLQILLGGRPAEVITLLPRLNVGPEKGERTVRAVREWIEAAKRLMRGETDKLESGFSLHFTAQAARRLLDRDPFRLEPEELLNLFSYRFTGDTQRKRRREAMKRLREAFDEDLPGLNAACGQSFLTWEAAVEALVEGRIVQQDCLMIRREVFRLYEGIHVICQTPNLVFIPLTYEVAPGGDESETSQGLRRLYVALVLSLVFDASVAIHKPGEPVDFRGGAGAAYVPPVPAIRSLVGGYEWLPLTEAKRWLGAIGAASMLARDTGLPARSALYQILTADPPEKLARRIEEAGGRILALRHLRLIEQLPGFRTAQEKGVLP